MATALAEKAATEWSGESQPAICGTVLFGSCARSTQRDRGRRVATHGDPLLSHRTASASRMRVACGRVDLADGDGRPFLGTPQARPG
jgi:hypothetical protein